MFNLTNVIFKLKQQFKSEFGKYILDNVDVMSYLLFISKLFDIIDAKDISVKSNIYYLVVFFTSPV